MRAESVPIIRTDSGHLEEPTPGGLSTRLCSCDGPLVLPLPEDASSPTPTGCWWLMPRPSLGIALSPRDLLTQGSPGPNSVPRPVTGRPGDTETHFFPLGWDDSKGQFYYRVTCWFHWGHICSHVIIQLFPMSSPACSTSLRNSPGSTSIKPLWVCFQGPTLTP